MPNRPKDLYSGSNVAGNQGSILNLAELSLHPPLNAPESPVAL